MSKRVRIFMLAAVFMLLTGVVSAQDDQKFQCGFSQAHNGHPWRVNQTANVRDYWAENLTDEMDMAFTDGRNRPDKQAADVEDLLARGVECLILTPVQAEALTPITEQAMEAGVVVITLDREVNTPVTLHIGADRLDSGEIQVFGQPARITSPQQAIALGIGLLPEDRKTEGLLLRQKVAFNVTIANLGQYTRGGALRLASERKQVEDYVQRLNVRTPSVNTPIRSLSGGNQQKCVFAKWLNANCRILLADEPTRGVDVGAKQEIYQLLADLAARGVAIIMVSSELPEILGLSDRVLVMREGRVLAEFSRAEATEERIMRHATGNAI